MSRKDDLICQFGTTGTIKRLTKEIKSAHIKKMKQTKLDTTIREILKGKHRRRR